MLCLLSLKHCLRLSSMLSSAVHRSCALVVCMMIINTTRYSTVISFQQSYCRMSKIYKGWFKKLVYALPGSLADAYFYLIRVNFAFFMRVMPVLNQFCCQLETFPTKHSYFCGSVTCYTMRLKVKHCFYLNEVL